MLKRGTAEVVAVALTVSIPASVPAWVNDSAPAKEIESPEPGVHLMLCDMLILLAVMAIN
jgi:hypothetical protein